ncbi:MAG: DUF485 domain-containing protein [Thermodesulfovibrionales bacterium]|nr:DUF485 domain-containing protein [Thermodesulfovibrionales bacterium]
MKKDQILEDPDFKKLKSSKWRVSLFLGSLVFILYYGFVLLMAYNKPFFANKVADIYVGIPIGVFVLASTILITVIYVAWANNVYDNLVDKVKEKIRR